MRDTPITREGEHLSTTQVPLDNSTEYSKQSFVGDFSLSIPLGIVCTRLYVANIVFFDQLSVVGDDKRSTIIRDDSFGNFELADDIIRNEVGYSHPGSSPGGCHLDPFGVAFSYSQDPYVTFGRRVDGTNEVEGLGVKWLGSAQTVESNVGAWIRLPLTYCVWHLRAKEVASASIVCQ